jgi:hypothetical protein
MVNHVQIRGYWSFIGGYWVFTAKDFKKNLSKFCCTKIISFVLVIEVVYKHFYDKLFIEKLMLIFNEIFATFVKIVSL